jgi:uracil-DNA glycosylase family 4
MQKNPGCSGCVFAKSSVGFCPDAVPTSPKLAIVLRMAGKDEVINGQAMSGKAGRWWFSEFFEKVGLRRSDVLIANVLRCFPNSGEFPVGILRKQTITSCRRWDSDLEKFKATHYIVTFSPTALFKAPQQVKLIRRSVELAKQFIDEGKRPILLMGDETREKYAPWLQGQMKKWNRHWWAA